jgi:hypothetical protein
MMGLPSTSFSLAKANTPCCTEAAATPQNIHTSPDIYLFPNGKEFRKNGEMRLVFEEKTARIKKNKESRHTVPAS